MGFGLAAYGAGTIIGAVGEGSLDALFGGMAGIMVGLELFAQVYPGLNNSILKKGDFGELTFPQWFKVNPWVIVLPFSTGILLLLLWFEKFGL